MLTGLWNIKDIENLRQNRSKNKLALENAVTRAQGACSLRPSYGLLHCYMSGDLEVTNDSEHCWKKFPAVQQCKMPERDHISVIVSKQAWEVNEKGTLFECQCI